MTRFEDYGGFPTDRRVFVLPEPEPRRTRPVTIAKDVPVRAETGREGHVASVPVPLQSRPPAYRTAIKHRAQTDAHAVAVALTERELFLGALQRHGGWVRARVLAIATGIAELRACHLLDSLWRAGLVRRQHRAFCPREEREYRWRDTEANA